LLKYRLKYETQCMSWTRWWAQWFTG